MTQAREIAEALVEETGDIDLVLAYGGLARGTTNQFSDIDLIVISDSVDVSWSFVLNGRPVSMHTMSWNKATNIARGLDNSWSVGASIFEQHLVLWARSEEVEKRFQNLSSNVLEGSQEVLRRAVTRFTCLYGELWRLEDAVEHDDSLTSAFLIWNIATGIVHILAALNRSPLTNNWGQQLLEIAQFKIAPLDFVSHYKALVTSPPSVALPIARELIIELDVLVRAWFDEQQMSKSDIRIELEGETTGIADCLNKILSASISHDLVATRYAAVEFAEFAVWFLRCLKGESVDPRRFGKILDSLDNLLPDSQAPLEVLLTSFEINKIVEAGKELAKQMQSLAKTAGLKSTDVETITEAREYLRIEIKT